MIETYVVLFLIALIFIVNGKRFSAWYESQKTDFNEVDDDIYSLIQEMIEEGMISSREHPIDSNLRIYNYTPAAAYSRTWNEATLMCRGLILREQTIISRPFKKFFNYGELTEVPTGTYRVFDKADGSLGIGYVDSLGLACIATRGSFSSDQAIRATNILHSSATSVKFVTDCYENELTPLFEIIYPENRIVLNYGSDEKLILLAVIDNRTGNDVVYPGWDGETVKEFDMQNIEELLSQSSDNREGFVLLYKNNIRVKIKFDEYVLKHKICTQISTRSIWEMLVSGGSVAELANAGLPDELYVWADERAAEYTAVARDWTNRATEAYNLISSIEDRKEFAQEAIKSPLRAAIFRLRDGKSITDMAWKEAEPRFERPITGDDND